MSAGVALNLKIAKMADKNAALKLWLEEAAPVPLPANFTGLGYEMSSVAAPGLLSPVNDRYVELVRGLGPQGVLRVGGIVANYTRYEPEGAPRAEKQDTVITRQIVEQFSAFLEKVGWTAIWSVNFAQGSIEDAIKEARAVRDALGSRLLALEIGNEVDSYGHGQPFRPASYDYDAYRKEYREWHSAILKAVPGIPFAAPDTARSYDWVERMAADAGGDVQLLTAHYYRNGQRNGSAEQLLKPDERLRDVLAHLRTASQQSGIPWRMCETNSFSGGGRPGVSDTFIGALWTLDFMLLLATYGCAGVNIETGVNQLGFVSSYSPIQDDGKGMNSAGVPYYGMLAFAKAAEGCNEMLPVHLESSGENVTAYALGADKKPRCIVVINRDSSQDVDVSLDGVKMSDGIAFRLLAPAPDSKSNVTFGGSAVDGSGRWSASRMERTHGSKVNVARMSAVVVRAAAGRSGGVPSGG
jgi:hypothetical protein